MLRREKKGGGTSVSLHLQVGGSIQAPWALLWGDRVCLCGLEQGLSRSVLLCIYWLINDRTGVTEAPYYLSLSIFSYRSWQTKWPAQGPNSHTRKNKDLDAGLTLLQRGVLSEGRWSVFYSQHTGHGLFGWLWAICQVPICHCLSHHSPDPLTLSSYYWSQL